MPTTPCARWRWILAATARACAAWPIRRGEARAALANAEAADLVVASYMIGEISEGERQALAELMWAKTRDTLLVVEPGTPAGYARIIALRAQLIAAGAHVAAPCPHDGACPLAAPDWCHFTQRLPRSRAHKQLKRAELAYEDEKFSYVALTRAPAARRPARVLAQPDVSKVEVTAKLCTDGGVLPQRSAPRQGRLQPLQAICWGDAIFEFGKYVHGIIPRAGVCHSDAFASSRISSGVELQCPGHSPQ